VVRDDMAVGGDLHVDLDAVDRRLEAFQRAFEAVVGPGAVASGAGDQQGFAHGQVPMGRS
jgi:hypothetical protein